MSAIPPAPMAPVAAQAAATAARATGRTLVLGNMPSDHEFARTVTDVDHWPDAKGVYDSVVSIGTLAAAGDIAALLTDLSRHLDTTSVVYFCEPTKANDSATVEPPHDITAMLWRTGFTVFECRRLAAGRWPKRQEYCWGRARLTPPGTPPRTWAD
jgi:hypothetical protein